MNSLFHVLNLAKTRKKLKDFFRPSSIGGFGPTTPRQNTPQYTVMEPSTVWNFRNKQVKDECEYYHKQYGVDVRSIRYGFN